MQNLFSSISIVIGILCSNHSVFLVVVFAEIMHSINARTATLFYYVAVINCIFACLYVLY